MTMAYPLNLSNIMGDKIQSFDKISNQTANTIQYFKPTIIKYLVSKSLFLSIDFYYFVECTYSTHFLDEIIFDQISKTKITIDG